jgi:hypothetical protein
MRADAAVKEPQLCRLLAFWAERCGSDGLPSKRTLDPILLFTLLPYLILVEVLRDGEDFRIRLAGSEIEDRFGLSLRGLSVYDANRGVESPDTTGQWRESYSRCCPYYRRGPVRLHDSRHFNYCRLILPIADNDGPQDRPAFLLAGAMLQPVTRKEWEDGKTVVMALGADDVEAILRNRGA